MIDLHPTIRRAPKKKLIDCSIFFTLYLEQINIEAYNDVLSTKHMITIAARISCNASHEEPGVLCPARYHLEQGGYLWTSSDKPRKNNLLISSVHMRVPYSMLRYVH
jgi:hypothetical protein